MVRSALHNGDWITVRSRGVPRDGMGGGVYLEIGWGRGRHRDLMGEVLTYRLDGEGVYPEIEWGRGVPRDWKGEECT